MMKIKKIIVVTAILGASIMMSSCSGLIDAIFDTPTQEQPITPTTGETLGLDTSSPQSQANAQ